MLSQNQSALLSSVMFPTFRDWRIGKFRLPEGFEDVLGLFGEESIKVVIMTDFFRDIVSPHKVLEAKLGSLKLDSISLLLQWSGSSIF